jgi:chromosome condensin MukBEF ATPase and DNA-binding subunit MukB
MTGAKQARDLRDSIINFLAAMDNIRGWWDFFQRTGDEMGFDLARLASEVARRRLDEIPLQALDDRRRRMLRREANMVLVEVDCDDVQRSIAECRRMLDAC